jgi:hypothetical protein
MFTDIQGTWPTHEKIILVSCDETYFNRYFPRFYKTFTKHWQLPIHAHIIDPSKESLERVEQLGVSYTWCDTTEFDWRGAVDKFRIADQPYETIRQWLYECYCQCQRFVVMGSNMTEKQSVIVADVDAYAQHTPTDGQREILFSNSAFTEYNGRLMATFCHFHPKNIEDIKRLSSTIVDQLKDVFVQGTDQTVLKKIFNNRHDITNLRNGLWIRHYDVKTSADVKAHETCLVYHEKGTRGKIKDVNTAWTDIK